MFRLKRISSFLIIILLSFFLANCKRKDLQVIADAINITKSNALLTQTVITTNLENLAHQYNVDIIVKFNEPQVARYDHGNILITSPAQTTILIIDIILKHQTKQLIKSFNLFIAGQASNNTDPVPPEIPLVPLPPIPLPEPEPLMPTPQPESPAPIPDPAPIEDNENPVKNALSAPLNSPIVVEGFLTAHPINLGFTLQDNSGAIIIKYANANANAFNEAKKYLGQYVIVKGIRSEYHGAAQLSFVESLVPKAVPAGHEYPQAVNLALIALNTQSKKIVAKQVNLTKAKLTKRDIDSHGNIKLLFTYQGQTINWRYDARTNSKWGPILKALVIDKSYDINNATCTYYDGIILSVSEKLTFTLNTTSPSGPFNVYFDLHGGTLNALPQVINLNDIVTNPGTPQKDNFIFLGWSLTNDKNHLYEFNTPVTNDLVLHAVYKYLGGSEAFDDVNGYYTGLKGLTGATLKHRLAAIIKAPATGYDVALTALPRADESLTRPGFFYLIYTGDSNKYHYAVNSSNNWNREHVVPKSKLKLQHIPKGELHNLRACDIKVNSNRSNYPFVEGSGHNHAMGGTYYPGDEHRGDVARIILYMNVRYNLNINVVGNLKVLLKWHREDPVNAFEKRRNNILAEYQKNRNPFIDNPQLAELIYGDGSNGYNFSLPIHYLPPHKENYFI